MAAGTLFGRPPPGVINVFTRSPQRGLLGRERWLRSCQYRTGPAPAHLYQRPGLPEDLQAQPAISLPQRNDGWEPKSDTGGDFCSCSYIRAGQKLVGLSVIIHPCFLRP